jgi:hypothetical protein
MAKIPLPKRGKEMNEQIDDFAILGFSFTTQQLKDLREAIDVLYLPLRIVL